MTRVFISHSTKDADFVRNRLRPLFDEHGVIAWCSSMDMTMAADWQRQIRAALAQADWFIVVLSPDAQQSEWVQAETHWALEHMRGRVIPLMAKTCEPGEVHLRLGTVQYIDFRSDVEAAGRHLLTVLLDGRPQAGHPAPIPDSADFAPDRTSIVAKQRYASVLFRVQTSVGPDYEQRLEIRQWAVIGRAEDVDLRILDNCVSRRHAKIMVGQSGGKTVLTLTDLNSANGTFVNQEQVLSSHALKIGDIIEIGSVRLHVEQID
jgi:hypothetical protein